MAIFGDNFLKSQHFWPLKKKAVVCYRGGCTGDALTILILTNSCPTQQQDDSFPESFAKFVQRIMHLTRERERVMFCFYGRLHLDFVRGRMTFTVQYFFKHSQDSVFQTFLT